MEGHWKFLGEGGIVKAKLCEEKYEAKLEFPVGEEVQQKNREGNSYEFFLELHIKSMYLSVQK